MKKITMIAILCILLFVGCYRHPQKYSYTVIIPPTSPEGKKCVTECEKMMIQKKQLANQEYMTQAEEEKRNRDFYKYRLELPSKENRDSDYSRIEREYDQCVLDCGGKKETKTGMR